MSEDQPRIPDRRSGSIKWTREPPELKDGDIVICRGRTVGVPMSTFSVYVGLSRQGEIRIEGDDYVCPPKDMPVGWDFFEWGPVVYRKGRDD